MEKIVRFYRMGWYSYKALYDFGSFVEFLVARIINPILQVCFFSLLISYINRDYDITYYIIGNSFILCVNASFFGVGTNMTYERMFGTLQLFVVAPGNNFLNFLSKVFFYIFDGSLNIMLGIFIGRILFGLNLDGTQIIYIYVLAIITMISSCSLATLIGEIGLITRDINLILNISSMILLALSGAQFSISILPMFIQRICILLPVGRMIMAARMVVNGNGGIETLIIQEIALAIGYFIVSYGLYKTIEKIARKTASLSAY